MAMDKYQEAIDELEAARLEAKPFQLRVLLEERKSLARTATHNMTAAQLGSLFLIDANIFAPTVNETLKYALPVNRMDIFWRAAVWGIGLCTGALAFVAAVKLLDLVF